MVCRERALPGQETPGSHQQRGGTKRTVGTGAGTICGSVKKCYNCKGVGHLPHQCPSRAGTTLSHGKQTTGDHYGSLSNVSTAASSSSGGNNRKPPPPKKHPKAGPLRGGGQPGSQATSTSGAATAGRKRARDPTTTSAFTPPNKQATGRTRFSYAAAVEGGERVVLVSLDGTALTKEDPRLLEEAVNKWTLDVQSTICGVPQRPGGSRRQADKAWPGGQGQGLQVGAVPGGLRPGGLRPGGLTPGGLRPWGIEPT